MGTMAGRLIAFLCLVVLVMSPGPASAEPSTGEHLETVVLIHGFGRSNRAMWRLAARLESAGFHVQRVGYKSLKQTPEKILMDVTSQIEGCCVRGGQDVHFVGHSFGGLLIRAYLEQNRLDNLGRVVLIGTPNQGTDIVDRYRDRWWARLLGPTALALGTDDGSFPKSIADPYYPVGVIAGESGRGFNDRILPGKDDGLVPVESTRVNGMSDFIVIKAGHAALRHNKHVAEQTILFLREGRFSVQL